MLRFLAALILSLCAAGICSAEPITIRMMGGPNQGIPPKEATDPRSLARRAVFEAFQAQNPDVTVANAGGLELVGNFAESGFLMSMAGDTAPDVFYVNFRQYYKFVDEGFCRPLDDLIARDPGSLSRVNPTILGVVKSYDGHVYAMPWYQVALALYYRRDFFEAAGLDPARPPRTWAEFYEDGQRLVESRPGLNAFAFGSDTGDEAYLWVDFLWQAGGEVVRPAENGLWRAAVATPEGAVALDFYRKMVRDTWQGPGAKTYGPIATLTPDLVGLERDDKVAMWFDYTNDLVLASNDINPSKIGIAAMPAGPAGSQNEINAGMWAINSSVKDPKKLDACWRFIKFFSGEAAAKVNTDRFVDLGLGKLCNPTYLKKFGYSDLLSQVDPAYVKANEELFLHGHPEPYGRNCEQVYLVLGDALDRARLERTPSLKILQDVQRDMDEKLLGYVPPERLRIERAWAAVTFGGLLAIGISLGVFAYRRARVRVSAWVDRLPAGTNRQAAHRFVLFGVLPAALTIAMWAYFPLARGLEIAFQEYHVVGASRWIGFDNFIAVFTQPIFYRSLANSFLFVGLTILIGFLLPVGLALILDEIPFGRAFFRTVFYLPAMTSPLVIALLWRQIYDKSETGLLNQILLPLIHLANTPLGWLRVAPIAERHDWLGDPSLAMFAVVLPGVWAAAGPGTILYSAALKNIPQERYEAADIDGASWVQKISKITVPALKPLMLINLLGVFIGGFKAFDNVFILTQGGPLDATHTIGFEIWTNAFLFLKFGYATAAAWVMGAILVGFTMIQVKSLLRMRFSGVTTTP